MSSIYGVILNLALIKGVKASHGHITMSMMNKLSNAAVAKDLPQAYVPEMKRILFSGIHNIMLTALVLIIFVILILAYLFRREAVKKTILKVE